MAERGDSVAITPLYRRCKPLTVNNLALPTSNNDYYVNLEKRGPPADRARRPPFGAPTAAARARAGGTASGMLGLVRS